MKDYYLVPVKVYKELVESSGSKNINEKNNIYSAKNISPEMILEIINLVDSKKIREHGNSAISTVKCKTCKHNNNEVNTGGERNNDAIHETGMDVSSINRNSDTKTQREAVDDEIIKNVFVKSEKNSDKEIRKKIIMKLENNDNIEFKKDGTILIRPLDRTLNIDNMLNVLLLQNTSVSDIKDELKYIVSVLPDNLIVNWRARKLKKRLIGSGNVILNLKPNIKENVSWIHY